MPPGRFWRRPSRLHWRRPQNSLAETRLLAMHSAKAMAHGRASRPRIATCEARVTGRRRDGHERSGDQHHRSGATRTSKQDRWQKDQEIQPSTPLIEGSSNSQFQYGVAGVWVKLVKPQSRWIELAADLCASTAARGSLARWGMGKIERRTDPNWEFFRAFSSACHVQRTRWK